MNKIVTQKQIIDFQNHILAYYTQKGRIFAWRTTNNPYHILVSEIMLQQTQTDRVIPKYEAFLKEFPTIEALAQAPLRAVLSLWQGLGYNRRGMALHQAAKIIAEKYEGKIPECPQTLDLLPGIGPYTAGAVCAFAFNRATPIIETNIRSVFIHFFFQGLTKIHDNDILQLVEKTLYKQDPRSWYYALMDYGAMLKKKTKNPNKKSAHYATQSKFEGSDRQIRGAVIRLLTKHIALPKETIILQLGAEVARTEKILESLCTEGLIEMKAEIYSIPS